jgi:nitric oxide reductase subunit C
MLAWFMLGFGSAGSAQEVSEEERYVPNIENGRRIVMEEIDCLSCHVIKGKGGKVGPDLTQVGIRRSEDWLYDFLMEPDVIVPDTKMPQFDWEDDDLEDVIAFLVGNRKTVDREKILTLGGAPGKVGETLVKAYDCRACHRIGEGGLSRYPDLTYQGSKVNRNWEWVWLRDPQKIRPGTFMPTFGFSEGELAAITAYLGSLRCDGIDQKRLASC